MEGNTNKQGVPHLACVELLPPCEGGLHDRRSDCTDLCHGKAASLVIGCAVDPTIFCDLLYLYVRITGTLAIGSN